GVTTLDNGAKQLQSGSKELSTGLAGGADEIAQIQVTDANIAMFSNPVGLSGETVNGLNYYRDSTAPYILSLALFVGILILSFVIDFKKPVVTPGSAFSWYASKLMNLSIFAIAQGLLVSLFALLFIQLQVDSVVTFVLFSVFTSLTFMAIVFFLVVVGGNVGRFVALAFLVLQLSTTGSNLPIPMLPENLQALSKFLPLTYSNAGFKSIISLGDTSFLLANVFVLFMFLVGFALLTLVAFLFFYKKGHAQVAVAV
ncbi:MAG: YhgE/Pip family protein, partial [Firmicutes bacterium]|nr:YhgE/Pip family protein [Bacillota bacterium]